MRPALHAKLAAHLLENGRTNTQICGGLSQWHVESRAQIGKRDAVLALCCKVLRELARLAGIPVPLTLARAPPEVALVLFPEGGLVWPAERGRRVGANALPMGDDRGVGSLWATLGRCSLSSSLRMLSGSQPFAPL